MKERDPEATRDLDKKLNKSDLIYFDEQVSMLERTAHKFGPIICEVAKRMVKHKAIVKNGVEIFQSHFIIEKHKRIKL